MYFLKVVCIIIVHFFKLIFVILSINVKCFLLEEQKAALTQCIEKQKKAEKLIKELEAKTSKSTREAKIKEAEKAVANCKKKAATSMEKYNTYLAVNILFYYSSFILI